MTTYDSRSIGRAGDEEDEPSFSPPPPLAPSTSQSTSTTSASPTPAPAPRATVGFRDAAAIGRAGGEDDEPSFASPPFAPRTVVTSEVSPIGRTGEDDDEPPPVPGWTAPSATVPPDEAVSLPSKPSRSKQPTRRKGPRNDWGAAATSLIFCGIVAWLSLQVAALVRATQALPLVFRVPALAAEAVALGIAIVWIVRIVWLFVGFRKRPDKDWPSYYRRIGQSGTFAEEYPDEARERARKSVRALAVRQTDLTKKWERDAVDFEKERRKVAEGIAKRHALLTAIKTATSPWKIVDVLAVFYNGTRMVERIARLYGQRCNSSQAFRLVCQWGFNLYVAGELGDVMEKGAEMTIEKAVELLQNTGAGISWLGTVLPMTGKIFAKAGEGAANYYLCYRLGKMAIDEFSPNLDRPPTPPRRGKLAIWAMAVLILLGAWFFSFGILSMVRS